MLQIKKVKLCWLENKQLYFLVKIKCFVIFLCFISCRKLYYNKTEGYALQGYIGNCHEA
jgi:hypothetical protein